jgi:hypothetical protein
MQFRLGDKLESVYQHFVLLGPSHPKDEGRQELVCWLPAISLPTQSVTVGEVGQCMGVLWRAGGGVGVLRTGPVAAGVRVYSSVSHL